MLMEDLMIILFHLKLDKFYYKYKNLSEEEKKAKKYIVKTGVKKNERKDKLIFVEYKNELLLV